MLLEFSVKNFRSIKEQQTLSLIADSGKSKPDNYVKYDSDNILKTSAIYGANASGKSNIIRAFNVFHEFIINSTDLKIGEKIRWYIPFAFDVMTQKMPTEYNVIFIGRDKIKYQYHIIYNQNEILFESLDYYPKSYKANLFTRRSINRNIEVSHARDNKKINITNKGVHIKLGKSFADKRINKKILPNQLFLSKIGNSGHEQMGNILLYFRNIMIWNALSKQKLQLFRRKIEEFISDENSSEYRNKVNKLIQFADTKIESISVKKVDENDFSFPSEISDKVKNQIINQNKFVTTARHSVFENGKKVGTANLNFIEESLGTQALFVIGGIIIKQLQTGGVLFVDELENSLHPDLCKFLVKLFHNPVSNPKNAQLIFATHETSLLDKNIFRKDQICLTEKDEKGATELFSITDFEGVRDDTPFGRWYLKGKFGGRPNIKEVSFIFDDE